MEPEPTTHTVAEVIAQFKAQIVRHPQNGKPADGYWEAVDDMVSALEAALRAENASHEETARELAQDVKDELSLGGHHLEEMLAAALASVRRATLRDAWQVCPVTGEAHDWVRSGAQEMCHKCAVLRWAISPADVKGENDGS